jgi:hypothetical protein
VNTCARAHVCVFVERARDKTSVGEDGDRSTETVMTTIYSDGRKAMIE